MKKTWLALFISSLLFSCVNDFSNKPSLYKHLPEDASLTLKLNNLETFINSTENNSVLNTLERYTSISKLDTLIDPIKNLNPETEAIISFQGNSYILASKYSDDLFKIDSLKNVVSESFSSPSGTITKTSIENATIYNGIKDSIFLASNNLETLKAALDKSESNLELEKLFNTTDQTKIASTVINTKSIQPKFSNYAFLNQSDFTNQIVLDLDISDNEFSFSGITQANDSTSSLINSFKNTIPQENSITQISPRDAYSVLSITYNDYSTFKINLSRYNKKVTDSINQHFDYSSEIGVIARAGDEAIVIKSIDPELTEEHFENSEFVEGFRDVVINRFESPEIISEAFSPFINKDDASYFMRLDTFFIFSDNVDFLKSIITDYLNNNTIQNSEVYQNISEQLNDESSILVLMNDISLNAVFDDNFSEEKNLNLSQYKLSAVQYIYDNNFAHVNGIVKAHKRRRQSKSVTEEYNISLDADMLMAPQTVKNHITRQKDIVAQDVNNVLYLISNKGTVLWKKQLHGPVLGKIEQIDTYKNGRLQLAFATPKRVYVLDRNGKDVNAFPLKFNDEITQPLSVFDYDKKKEYRLLVTQGRSLLMYDKNGKSVSGFTFNRANNTISTQPKHFRIGTKDYIVFAEGQKLQILNRVGKTRIDVKPSFNFSGNSIFNYKNSFTTTTEEGTLLQIDTKGKTNISSLNLSKDHFLTTTSKTLVSLDDNKLTIRSKSIELDFGDYADPQIFYINDKIYVTTTDLQTKKVYLFDSQTKPIDNFPVYGNSAIALDNIDKDRNLEFVVKGDDNAVVIYEITQ
ncbi:ribonuclease HII [Winogradskyella sp. 3972H.M.0a.05]|uniref:ribonuclease HII n=1 Tax=Winogradskyella sp. 3972H.M.0a.05 TaxID=2950277 RepID=UPI0033910792